MIKLLFVSTTGGWVSFAGEPVVSYNEAGWLTVTRGKQVVSVFKPTAWNGYVWAEVDNGDSDAIPGGITRGGPQQIS